jgi:3-methylcrotonyl-CoA carboxylase beta subunit
LTVLTTNIPTSGPLAEANSQAWAELIDDLDEATRVAAPGGPERSRERHIARGKLLHISRILSTATELA